MAGFYVVYHFAVLAMTGELVMELLSARIDMEGLVAFGFYICRAAEYHPLSNQNPNKMISASDCLCDHEPQIFLCHGWKPRGDDENYISRFRSKDEYLKNE